MIHSSYLNPNIVTTAFRYSSILATMREERIIDIPRAELTNVERFDMELLHRCRTSLILAQRRKQRWALRIKALTALVDVTAGIESYT
jgi:hypothetical protein